MNLKSSDIRLNVWLLPEASCVPALAAMVQTSIKLLNLSQYVNECRFWEALTPLVAFVAMPPKATRRGPNPTFATLCFVRRVQVKYTPEAPRAADRKLKETLGSLSRNLFFDSSHTFFWNLCEGHQGTRTCLGTKVVIEVVQFDFHTFFLSLSPRMGPMSRDEARNRSRAGLNSFF